MQEYIYIFKHSINRKFAKLEEENNYLTNYNNELIIKGKEKMEIFINLCSQYSRKILSVGILIRDLNTGYNINNSQNIMIEELSVTIDKFNSIVENPKLINNLLNLPEEIDISFNFSNFNDNEVNKNESILINIINELESKVNTLKEELNTLHEEVKANRNNNIGYSKDEINELFQKIKVLKKAKEDSESCISDLKKTNKELTNSYKLLEEERNDLEKKFKHVISLCVMILIIIE